MTQDGHWSPDPGTQPTTEIPPVPAYATTPAPGTPAHGTPAAGSPSYAPPSYLPPTAAPDAQPPSRVNRWLVAGLVAAIVLLIATAGLAAYLWIVNARWTAQNEQLRAVAGELGSTLGDEQATTAAQAEEIAALQVELEDVTARISDLANEEAQANDSQGFLEELADAFVECIGDHDTLLTQALSNGYSYDNSNAAAVQDDLDAYCDSLIGAWEDYQAGSR